MATHRVTTQSLFPFASQGEKSLKDTIPRQCFPNLPLTWNPKNLTWGPKTDKVEVGDSGPT